MLSLPDAASIRAALDQPLAADLRAILTDKLSIAEQNGLADLTHILVIQSGDAEEVIEQELGWSPLVNPMEGCRFGEAGFTPYWAWLQNLGGWYELIHTVGNDGFANVVLVEDAPKLPDDLLRMCRMYVEEGGACAS